MWCIKRLFDLMLAGCAVIILAVPIALLAVFVKLTSKGPVLYWSDRVGRNNDIFKMPKFRTMYTETPIVATHLLEDPERYLTKWGGILRKFSLDELPQLLSIIKGDMSFVGPRPALYNQDDLVALRTEKGIHQLTPGLTGWAQVNGRDGLPIPVKVEFDHYYLLNQSFVLDLKIILQTALRVVRRDGVNH